MRIKTLLSAMMVTLLAIAGSMATASEPAYGHPDFYPSPERPLGWRGDGTGSWPGARVVTDWNAKTGKNIVWKADTPGAGLCQPIVAGEKVFVTADPNLLLCYKVHDGALLWQVAIDHTLKMPAQEAKLARAEQAFFDGRWLAYATWRCELVAVEEAAAKATGKDVGAIRRQWYLRHGYALPGPDDKEHQQALADLAKHPELLAEYRRPHGLAMEHGWRKGGGNAEPMDSKVWPFVERYRAAQERWDLWCPLADNWLGFTTYSFATPVTDGRYVYVTTANNAVAAVDYQGEIAWLVWEHLPDQRGVVHTRYVPSPVLCDGKLVVFQSGHLRVYDAASGGKLWDVYGPSAVAAGKKPSSKGYARGDPEGPTPLVGELPLPDGGTLGVVVDNGGQIWRLADGKLIGKTEMIRYGTGVLLPERGLLVGKRSVFEIAAKAPDRVETKQRWTTGAGKKGVDLLKFKSAHVDGDRVLVGRGKNVHAYDLATGERRLLAGTGHGGGGPFGEGYISSITAGSAFYQVSDESKKGHDNDLFARYGGGFRCAIGDLETGATHVVEPAFIDRRFAGDGEWAVLNKTHCSGYQQNATPSVQANRLFYRSRGMLWCVGDPRQRFPVPSGCPDHARVD